MHALDLVQRWMQAVIMHPDGVEAGLHAPEARRHLQVEPHALERVVTPSRSLSALDRLAIYGTAYHARLLECLREEYPVLRHALGEELFDAFAAGYLQTYPSRSYTLTQLGARFPRYLVEIRPDDDEEGELYLGCADFLIDLATLERTFSEVFDAVGIEGQRLLKAEQLRSWPVERWLRARLIPVPCLRLLALNFPVQDYFRAVRVGEETVLGRRAEVYLAITRRDYTVHHYTLSRSEYQLLHALIAGQSMGQAIQQAAQGDGDDFAQHAARLHDWFQAWTANGFFRAVEIAD